MKTSNDIIADLERKLASAEAVIKGYEGDIEIQADKTVGLEVDLSEARGALATAGDTLSDMEQRALAAESNFDTAQDGLGDIRGQLVGAETDVSTLKDRIKELEEALDAEPARLKESSGEPELRRMLTATQSTLKAEERRNLNQEISDFLGLE